MVSSQRFPCARGVCRFAIIVMMAVTAEASLKLYTIPAAKAASALTNPIEFRLAS
jgi:hypothetical protein